MVSSTLQEATQNILSAASEMATSELTRDYRQRLIVSRSGKLEDGVQQFLLILNGDTESMEGEEHRTRMIAEQARDLKKQKVHLHKKVQCSPTFFPVALSHTAFVNFSFHYCDYISGSVFVSLFIFSYVRL